jgi:GNAT superfamily N-acetyltransferase
MSAIASPIRIATLDDLEALRALIPLSVRALSRDHYTEAQIESAIRWIFGPDTRLIEDGTYYVVDGATGLAAAGGWSRRRTLFGGDQAKGADDPLLDPATEPARIRAFYVHPDWTRRGLGRRILETCLAAAASAGFGRVELASTLPGVALYRSMGFEALEEFTADTPDGVGLPVVRMTRALVGGRP